MLWVFVKYLNIQRKKTTEQATIKEIKKWKRKEKEDKWTKRVVDLGIVAYRIIIKIAKKHAKGKFHADWTLIDVKEVGDKFH